MVRKLSHWSHIFVHHISPVSFPCFVTLITHFMFSQDLYWIISIKPIYATEKLATRRRINVSKVVCDTGTSNQSTASRKHIHHTHYCFLPNTTAADIIHTRSKAPTPAPIPTYMPNLFLTPGLSVAAGSEDKSYTASTFVIVTPTELKEIKS